MQQKLDNTVAHLHIVQAGAYVEISEDGSYLYPDLECQNISVRLVELESVALEDWLHFAPAQNGEKYILEPANPDELVTFEKTKEEAKDEKGEEGGIRLSVAPQRSIFGFHLVKEEIANERRLKNQKMATVLMAYSSGSPITNSASRGIGECGCPINHRILIAEKEYSKPFHRISKYKV